MARRSNPTRVVALGGIMAALAVVVMCMGGLIPVATFICPVVCIVLQAVVLKQCGRQIAWAWYGAVTILSLLLGPDKEAAVVFLFLGYYPIIKRWLDHRRFQWLWKGIMFNSAVAMAYFFLLNLLGLEQVSKEYAQLGTVMTVVMLVMGNITFFLLDNLLTMQFGVKKHRK